MYNYIYYRKDIEMTGYQSYGHVYTTPQPQQDEQDETAIYETV